MESIMKEFSNALNGMLYGGTIGISYSTPTGKFFAIAATVVIIIFAIIGLITVLSWLFLRKKKSSESPGEKWLRTGKS